jgi:hypothetical protein
MTTPVIIGDATLYCGDANHILLHVPSVQAVVTSPPYDGMRAYGGQDASKPDDIIGLLAECLTDGGVIMWNVADQVIDGSESGTSFRQALAFMDWGLRLHDTMIYCKEGVTFPDANRYHPAFEYMFVFSKGAPKHFNGIFDWRNKWAGSPMHGTDRQVNGALTVTKGALVGRDVRAFGLRRNWWPISNPYTGETAGHPAPMPYSMAADHIATWTDRGETVLDPFMGSGTTGVAALKQGRRFVGCEINPEYFDIACRRIEQAYAQPDMFVATPAKPTQEAML